MHKTSFVILFKELDCYGIIIIFVIIFDILDYLQKQIKCIEKKKLRGNQAYIKYHTKGDLAPPILRYIPICIVLKLPGLLKTCLSFYL